MTEIYVIVKYDKKLPKKVQKYWHISHHKASIQIEIKIKQLFQIFDYISWSQRGLPIMVSNNQRLFQQLLVDLSHNGFRSGWPLFIWKNISIFYEYPVFPDYCIEDRMILSPEANLIIIKNKLLKKSYNSVTSYFVLSSSINLSILIFGFPFSSFIVCSAGGYSL